MNHAYDSGCYCFNCCDAEERLFSRVVKDENDEKERQARKVRSFSRYNSELELQLIAVKRR